jgi:magnesium transporter
MDGDRNRILIESIRRLLRRGACSNLRKIVNKTHAADLTSVFDSLPLADQRRLFDVLEDPEQKGELFSRLEVDAFLNLVKEIDLEEIADIFEEMPTDDVADLLGQMPEDMADDILKKMKKDESEEVEDLLSYGDDTAGGIMVPDFIALTEDTTAKAAIESLQEEHQDVEMPFYLYVVDEYGKLVGVSSLRQLIVVPSETSLKAFMTTDVFSVTTDMDQEEVAKLVARYDILAVPVVDESNRLVGIVTVDDVIDIFRMEATEDMLKMAGAGEEYVETQSVLRSTRIRFPWLFVSYLGGMVAFYIVGRFEESIHKLVYLAAFIPVIMGMGGNIGTQSSTIVVRGLATGRLDIRDIGSVVVKECLIGLLLGLIYGILIGLVAHLKYRTFALALSVGLGLVCSMSVAALFGSLMPMVFARINIDPAVATGPFVTTSIDIISVLFYFVIATNFLGL